MSGYFLFGKTNKTGFDANCTHRLLTNYKLSQYPSFFEAEDHVVLVRWGDPFPDTSNSFETSTAKFTVPNKHAVLTVLATLQRAPIPNMSVRPGSTSRNMLLGALGC